MVSLGANGHTPSSSSSTNIDPNVVVRHLVELLETTLGASTEDLESPGSLLSGSKRHDTVQRCTRFASEPQNALYVLKNIIVPNQSDVDYIPPGTYSRVLDEI